MSKGSSTLSDVTTGAANYMVGCLQMTIVGGDSDRITSEQGQKALDETLVFQKCMVELRQALE